MTEHEDQYGWGDESLTSGLLDEYIGTITTAEFGVDIEYNPDTVRAMFDIEIVSHEDPDQSVQPGDTLEEAYNVGDINTWEVTDNGKRLARVDGKGPRFHQNSGYGQLIRSAMPGKKESMAGADKLVEVLKARAVPPTDARSWEGLTFRFKRLDFSFTNKEKEVISYQRVFPVEFVGTADGAAAAAPAATSGSGDDTTNSGPSREDVLALAAKHDEFSGFLAEAMSTYPGIESGDLAADVMDEKNGIFAEAHAS